MSALENNVPVIKENNHFFKLYGDSIKVGKETNSFS